jgi:hypothetical protein
MRAMAGAGAVLSRGREIPVAYDFVECAGGSRYAAEGEIFGDVEALLDLYNTGPCDLRLESGGLAHIVLTSCRLHGAAEAKVAGPLGWR